MDGFKLVTVTGPDSTSVAVPVCCLTKAGFTDIVEEQLNLSFLSAPAFGEVLKVLALKNEDSINFSSISESLFTLDIATNESNILWQMVLKYQSAATNRQ